jgi:hypothetical protein
MLDDFDLDFPEEEDEAADAAGNRNFMIIAGGLGGLLLIALICIAIYAMVILPSRQREAAQQETQQAATQTTSAQQTSAAESIEQTSIVLSYTPTVTDTPTPTETQTLTPEPSATSEGTGAAPTGEAGTPSPTLEGGPTTDPRTATVQALLTSAAAAQTQAAGSLSTVTATPTLVGALPDTGFFDDGGALLLITVAALLILVIVMARLLRESNA